MKAERESVGLDRLSPLSRRTNQPPEANPLIVFSLFCPSLGIVSLSFSLSAKHVVRSDQHRFKQQIQSRTLHNGWFASLNTPQRVRLDRLRFLRVRCSALRQRRRWLLRAVGCAFDTVPSSDRRCVRTTPCRLHRVRWSKEKTRVYLRRWLPCHQDWSPARCHQAAADPSTHADEQFARVHWRCKGRQLDSHSRTLASLPVSCTDRSVLRHGPAWPEFDWHTLSTSFARKPFQESAAAEESVSIRWIRHWFRTLSVHSRRKKRVWVRAVQRARRITEPNHHPNETSRRRTKSIRRWISLWWPAEIHAHSELELGILRRGRHCCSAKVRVWRSIELIRRLYATAWSRRSAARQTFSNKLFRRA